MNLEGIHIQLSSVSLYISKCVDDVITKPKEFLNQKTLMNGEVPWQVTSHLYLSSLLLIWQHQRGEAFTTIRQKLPCSGLLLNVYGPLLFVGNYAYHCHSVDVVCCMFKLLCVLHVFTVQHLFLSVLSLCYSMFLLISFSHTVPLSFHLACSSVQLCNLFSQAK